MTVFRPDSLPDLAVISPRVFGDERGFFFELFNHKTFQAQNLEIPIVQTNVSQSKQNVLRGLHYQWPNPQGKLVTCLQGEIWDIAVDIREGSPTFGQFHAEILNDQNHNLFWIPEGFAHGFLTLSPQALVCYHVSAPYSQSDDSGISFFDRDLNIEIPTPEATNLILSEKDQNLPTLQKAKLPTMRELQDLGFYKD